MKRFSLAKFDLSVLATKRSGASVVYVLSRVGLAYVLGALAERWAAFMTYGDKSGMVVSLFYRLYIKHCCYPYFMPVAVVFILTIPIRFRHRIMIADVFMAGAFLYMMTATVSVFAPLVKEGDASDWTWAVGIASVLMLIRNCISVTAKEVDR